MVLALTCAGLAIAGCGGSVDKTAVTLTVRPEGSPEKRLLSQIYAKALRLSGYTVKKAPAPPPGTTITEFQALKAGRIGGYPEYLSTALYYDFGTDIDELPTNPDAAYQQAKGDFEKKGLTAFPPAPYGIANAVGMLGKTAEERHLKTDSDLKGQAEEMTIKAPTYCHLSTECLGGIETYYGTAFESVSYEKAPASVLAWWRLEPDYRYEVLEDGESDASMLFTTDGRLAAEKDKFVILEDDRHAFPAGNVVWVTSPEVVDEAGPDYEEAIADAQEDLTLQAIRELNAKMELEGKTPAKVADEYLSSIDYTG